ncbi:hypothetical protein [Geosporobacter ferrireducens]|uniref:hypothetical protein n=1 Tax=Geosporobacter ferrireducens TaxID=1424294 RepID=UPI002356A9C2|nr:hypothetical protein [Geosporobacter ferrireducens]
MKEKQNNYGIKYKKLNVLHPLGNKEKIQENTKYGVVKHANNITKYAAGFSTIS